MSLFCCCRKGSPTEKFPIRTAEPQTKGGNTFAPSTAIYISGQPINQNDSSDEEKGSPSQSLRNAMLSAGKSTPNPLTPCLRFLSLDKDLRVERFYTITFHARNHQVVSTIEKTKAHVNGFFTSPTPKFCNLVYSLEMHPVKKDKIKVTLGPTIEISGIPTTIFYVTAPTKIDHNKLEFRLDPSREMSCPQLETVHFLRITPYELPFTEDDRL